MKIIKQMGNPKELAEQVLNSPNGKEAQDEINKMLKENNGNAELAFRNKCKEMGIDPDMATMFLKGMFRK